MIDRDEIPDRVLEMARRAENDPGLDLGFGMNRVTLYRVRDWMPIEVVHWSGAGILAMDLLREMVKGAVGDEG